VTKQGAGLAELMRQIRRKSTAVALGYLHQQPAVSHADLLQ